ncbi:MAG: cation transporting ATPase C-terminal domain-containing protein, partial [Anaerolineales bacterium]|nr:cation transporting ATPase C-terminal domain-containing protein [Anaerolineales bacterium]
LALQHFGFTQFGDDLLWCVSSSFWHFLPPFRPIISFYLDQFLGGRSQLAVVYLPFMQEIFKTVALPPTALLISLGLSTVVFWGVELEKLYYRRRRGTSIVQ